MLVFLVPNFLMAQDDTIDLKFPPLVNGAATTLVMKIHSWSKKC